MIFIQNPNVAFDPAEAPLTYLPFIRLLRSVGKRIRNCTWGLLTLQKPLTRWTGKPSGKFCRDSAYLTTYLMSSLPSMKGKPLLYPMATIPIYMVSQMGPNKAVSWHFSNSLLSGSNTLSVTQMSVLSSNIVQQVDDSATSGLRPRHKPEQL